MDKLKELKRQRKEIDEQIKQLIGQERTVGRAKIYRQHYPTDKPDRWSLSIKLLDLREEGQKDNERYFPVIASEIRGKVVNAIPLLIESLTKLYEQEMMEDEKCEET